MKRKAIHHYIPTLEIHASKRSKGWRKRMVARLKLISHGMLTVGEDTEYYGGFGEIGQHGREMKSASNLVLEWARGIEE